MKLTWELVKRPKGVKNVGSKWILKKKIWNSVKTERFKARFVAKGFTEKEGIGCKEISSLQL